MGHDGVPLLSAKMKVIHTARKIERGLQFISHLVSGNLTPDMRLPPMHPGPAHLEGVAANIR